MSDGEPTDRRWTDRPGTRRASVEHGGKGPGQRPRPRGVGPGLGSMSETRGQRLARRLRGTSRWAMRHRGSLLCLVGALGTVLSLLVFEGVVQLIAGVLTVTIAGTGAAVHHHQRNRTLHHGAGRRATAKEIREHHEARARTGRPATPEPSGDTVTTVRSHDRDTGHVRTYTRRRPGAAGPAPTRKEPE